MGVKLLFIRSLNLIVVTATDTPSTTKEATVPPVVVPVEKLNDRPVRWTWRRMMKKTEVAWRAPREQ
jgi:hypothetical protein